MNTMIIFFLVALSIIVVIWLTSRLRLQAFIALFIVSLLLALLTIPPDKVIATLKDGFGSTMASIGFLIIFGAMIGVILDRTRATISIADFILLKTGTEDASVNCTMEEDAKNITANSQVSIKGICSGIGQGDEELGIRADVYLTRCILIK